MRISDWSSDVCSSDLKVGRAQTPQTASMDKPPTAPATATLSPATLARAPHRLLFFIGAANVLLAMFWWTLWLVEARWHVLDLPQPDVYGGWRNGRAACGGRGCRDGWIAVVTD